MPLTISFRPDFLTDSTHSTKHCEDTVSLKHQFKRRLSKRICNDTQVHLHFPVVKYCGFFAKPEHLTISGIKGQRRSAFGQERNYNECEENTTIHSLS